MHQDQNCRLALHAQASISRCARQRKVGRHLCTGPYLATWLNSSPGTQSSSLRLEAIYPQVDRPTEPASLEVPTVKKRAALLSLIGTAHHQTTNRSANEVLPLFPKEQRIYEVRSSMWLISRTNGRRCELTYVCLGDPYQERDSPLEPDLFLFPEYVGKASTRPIPSL